MTEEFKAKNNIKEYEEVINSSFLNQETKKEYISYLKSFENYIADKNMAEIFNAYIEKLETNLLYLYSSDNALECITNNTKFSVSTKNKD